METSLQMKYLYDIVFCNSKNKHELYYKCDTAGFIQYNSDRSVSISAGSNIDLLTYFNCFSVIKWKEYTTLKTLVITGEIDGKAEIIVSSIGKSGRVLAVIPVNGTFVKHFDIKNLDGDILGLSVKAISDCCIQKITYGGEFEKWRDLKINVSICTFKREKYVTKTVEKLLSFSNVNPWLTTLVVDNGSTLDEYETKSLRIVHNPNYGGSGGFTRGLLENLKTKQNDYILLMDDDIDLDTTVLNHMYGLLCSLKEEYKECFLSGAMLRMNEPCIQHENTAYWGKIRHHSLGSGWNLSKRESLLKNEYIKNYDNHYGAWWFCCIPLGRIEKIGLPLPVFIRGDDIEYGIRNDKKVIHMNGIGIWHETFEKKQALWIYYFEYRNSFITNQYAKGCNRWTLLTMIFGRLVAHFAKGHFTNTKILNVALKDAMQGLEKITEIPADEDLKRVRSLNGKGNYALAVLSVIYKVLASILCYNSIHKSYISFRKDKLTGDSFWWRYLNVKL